MHRGGWKSLDLEEVNSNKLDIVTAKMTSKSVKLFNLEERKNSTGTAITEVDIFQWKNTLIDNLKRDAEFREFCTDTARWDFENVENRGFEDTVQGDGSAVTKASTVHSMLTKIASYAPKSIVREITRRTKSLNDIWNIAREWAGIQSSGAKHLEYYKTKMSYLKIDKEETKQEFFYRLRDAMEDTLIRSNDNITDDGEVVNINEDMTPAIKSLVVLDWLDAIGGPKLVEHVHRVYAKELETCTLSSLQSRMWKNIDSLMRESENDGDIEKVFRSKVKEYDQSSAIVCGNVGVPRRGNTTRFPGTSRQRSRGQRPKNTGFNPRGRGYTPTNVRGILGCKLCKANGSPTYKSHEISDCWLLNESERSKISQSYAKAQAIISTEDHEPWEETVDSDDNYEDEEEEIENEYD